MKVLIYNGKHKSLVINGTDRGKAILHLFKLFDEDNFYTDYLDSKAEKVFYKKAKNGDAEAAEALLVMRKNLGCEYEDDWEFVEVIEP